MHESHDFITSKEEQKHNPLRHHSPESERYISDPSQARIGIHAYPDKLHIVTMLSNALRSRARTANFWKAIKSWEDAGAIVYIVEIAFENRMFEVTERGNPRHLQLRTGFEFWHKENALQLGVQRMLPPEAQKILFLDADVMFLRGDWCQEILHQLAHFDVVQPFSEAIDIGPDSEMLYGSSPSFMHQYTNHGVPPHDPNFMMEFPHLAQMDRFDGSTPVSKAEGGYGWMRGKYWHPGLAMAWRRSALDAAGGLMDWLPTGSGDWHMMNALIGNLSAQVDPNHTATYKRWCKIWEDRVAPIRNNPQGGLGYMKGTIVHSYHGSKAARNYDKRHLFVIRTEFDPELDITRDTQGLWQLTGRNPKLRDGLRAYARMRNEDDVNMDWWTKK